MKILESGDEFWFRIKDKIFWLQDKERNVVFETPLKCIHTFSDFGEICLLLAKLNGLRLVQPILCPAECWILRLKSREPIDHGNDTSRPLAKTSS